MSRLFMSLWVLVCALAMAPSLIAAQANQGNYTGSYTTFAIPYAAACQNARGMAVDSSGSMYIACGANSSIIVMSSSGVWQRNISLPNGQLYSPFGIAFSGSSMYVTSLYENMVYQFTTSTGAVVTQWSNSLNNPWGIAVDGSGNVWVANYGAGNVLKFGSSGGAPTATFSTTSPAMYFPEEVAIDGSGNVFVVDTDNNRVVKFNSNGNVVATYNNTIPRLIEPGGIALDTQGSIYVCDTWNYAVIKLDSNGNQVETLSSQLTGSGTAKISAAAGLTIDSSNNVYVVDSINNNRILKFPATLINNGQSATAAASALALLAALIATLALL